MPLPLLWLVDMVGSTGAETSVVALRSMAAISLALTVTMVPLTAPSAVEPWADGDSCSEVSATRVLVLAASAAGGAAAAPSLPRKAAAASSPTDGRPMSSGGGGMALLTHLQSVGGQLPALPLAQLERQKASVTVGERLLQLVPGMSMKWPVVAKSSLGARDAPLSCVFTSSSSAAASATGARATGGACVGRFCMSREALAPNWSAALCTSLLEVRPRSSSSMARRLASSSSLPYRLSAEMRSGIAPPPCCWLGLESPSSAASLCAECCCEAEARFAKRDWSTA